MGFVEAFRRSVRRSELLGTIRQIPEYVVHQVTSRRADGKILRIEERDGFDRELGTDTSGIIELDGTTEEQLRAFARYQGTRPKTIRAVIEGLGVDHREYVFVDVGCGEGRPLLIATTYPFKRVVEIEFSPELCRIAEANLRIMPADSRRCGDAREVAVPREDSVFFLYEPFTPPILEGFLQHLRRSLDEAPRRALLVESRAGARVAPARAGPLVDVVTAPRQGDPPRLVERRRPASRGRLRGRPRLTDREGRGAAPRHVTERGDTRQLMAGAGAACRPPRYCPGLQIAPAPQQPIAVSPSAGQYGVFAQSPREFESPLQFELRSFCPQQAKSAFICVEHAPAFAPTLATHSL